MNDKKLLAQIGELITESLDPIKSDLKGVKQELGPIKADLKGVKQELGPIKADLKGVKQQLGPIKADLKGVKQQLDSVEIKVELVNKKVEQSQRETIEALSELINTGYNLHEERLKHVEEHIKSTSSVS